MKSILTFFLIFVLSDSYSQDTLRISTKSNTSPAISAYTTFWSQDVTEPDGTLRKGNNTILDSTYFAEDNGTKLLVKEIKWMGTNNSWFVRIDKLKPENYAPLSIDVRWNPSYVQHTDFEESLISGATIQGPLQQVKFSMVPFRNEGFAWASDGGPFIGMKIPDVPYFYIETVSGYPEKPEKDQKFFEVIGLEEITVNKLGKLKAKHVVNRSVNLDSHYWLIDVKPYIVKVMFEQNTGQKTEWVIESVK